MALRSAELFRAERPGSKATLMKVREHGSECGGVRSTELAQVSNESIVKERRLSYHSSAVNVPLTLVSAVAG